MQNLLFGLVRFTVLAKFLKGLHSDICLDIKIASVLNKLSVCLYLGHCTSFQHVTTRKCTSSLINIVLNALYCSKFLSISCTYKCHHLKVEGGKKIEMFYSCHSFVPSNFLQRLPTLKSRRFCFDKNGPPTPQKVPPKLYSVSNYFTVTQI